MIPNNLRVPFVYVEFDSSKAVRGASVLDYKVLLIAERLSSGSKQALNIDLVQSGDQARAFYGVGSQAHLMVEAFKKVNKFTPLYVCSVADSGSASTGSYGFAGTATEAGIIYAFVNGVHIKADVAIGDTASDVALALTNAINSKTSLPVTAVNASGNCNLTAKNKGDIGNQIDLRINYFAGEELPSGITCTITAMNGGTGTPNIQNVIDILGESWYQIIISNMTDTANLSYIETELASRFGPLRMIDGIYCTSRRGTVSTLSTFGNARNSKHVTCVHCEGIPNSPGEVASVYGAQLAYEGSIDPARPFQTLPFTGIYPPNIVDRFTIAENNILLHDGISTFQVDNGDVVRMQRAISMYQTNAVGADDISYLNVNTLLTLMYMRYDFRNYILRKYARAKLVNDGVRLRAGQQVISPSIGKAEAVIKFRDWEERGICEGFTQFNRDLVCQRSTVDPDRLDWILPPDLVNQFRVGGVQLQFLLQ